MREVEQFYNRFHYPYSSIKQNYRLNGESVLKFLNYEIRGDGFQQQKILDIGCGTGQRSIEMARAFPEASFTAIDFSKASIELASNQAIVDDVSNIRFEVSDIAEYCTDETYDVITAFGVIHHLRNPQLVLSHIARYLKKNGIVICWLYHSYGEFDRMLQRHVLQKLLANKPDDVSALQLMKELTFAISNNRYGKSDEEVMTEEDEISKNADAFLNPLVKTYEMKEVITLFQQANFEWVSLNQISIENRGFYVTIEEQKKHVQPWMLNIWDLLRSDSAYKYFLNLDNLSKFEIIESLVKPTGITIFAGKRTALNALPKRIQNNACYLT